MWKFVFGLFLAAHGLIHLGYVAPAPTSAPNYPFNLSESWLITTVGLDGSTVRMVGIALSVLIAVGFALSGLAAGGIVVPQGWGLPLTVASAIASLLLLLIFWHTWLVLGVAIDIALLFALLWLGWKPFDTVGA
jgi:hypothetical protein